MFTGIIESIRSKIDINEVIGSESYDFDQVSQSPAWIKAINDDSEKVPETEEYGISSFLYSARKPFHAARLMDFINTKLAVDDDDDDNVEVATTNSLSTTRILRSKGFFWLASRPKEMMIWSQAGGLFQLSPGGAWWVDTPKDLWPDDHESIQQIKKDWDEKEGDRRQELVFIGTDMNKKEMIESLDQCLLTPSEMALGPNEWLNFEDPFPELVLEDDDHDLESDDESVEMIR
jgi:G3E family GTPase